MNNQEILSPLTLKPDVTLIRSIQSIEIVSDYKKYLDIDISDILEITDSVKLFRCNLSSYQFYFPLHIAGTAIFYDKMQEKDWYYLEKKWEYDTAIQYVREGKKALEIGCGYGFFMEKLKDRNIKSTGIEFSEKAISACLLKKLCISSESIAEHADKNIGIYDYIFIFQVLEHIPEVHLFLKHALKTLKKDGLLFIGVPNNDSPILSDSIEQDLLPKNVKAMRTTNFPPHHMGKWNERSLTYLEKVFDLKLLRIHFEPLPLSIIGSKIYNRIIAQKTGSYLLDHSIYPCFKIFNLMFRRHLAGHTILAVFKK